MGWSTTAGPAEPSGWLRRRAGVLRTAGAVGVATGAYGVSFGALSVAAGLSVLQTCALSVLVFTGGSQLALVGILGSGGGVGSGVTAALLLGSRNLVYSMQLAPVLALRGWRRFVGAQLVIDESTAVSVVQDERRAGQLGFWATGLSVFVLWNAATVVGAVAGEALGDPRTFGLDAAAPAAFLALLWPRLTSGQRGGRATVAVAAVAAAVALAVVPVTRPGIPVLAAALVPVAFVVLGRRR